MAVKVGINGFGRIGRNVLRASLNDPNIEFVAVNDLTDPKTLAHLLKYDSILGNLSNKISAGADSITIDNKTIKVFKERDPEKLPWESVGAQVVVESTGHFTDANDAKKHMRGTVKKVIISAPAKNEDITVVLGVNHQNYDSLLHQRSGHPRLPAQRPAARPGGGHQHDSNLDRRGQSIKARPPRA